MKYQTLNHSTWECKYHVVFIPKYRKKALFKELRSHLGRVFRTLTEQKESRVEEGHVMPDHVHMLLSIPPKYAVAQVVGCMGPPNRSGTLRIQSWRNSAAAR